MVMLVPKNKRAIIVLSVFFIVVLYLILNMSNIILVFNGQLTPKSKAAMQEKLNIMQINEIVFSSRDLKDFNKQILYKNFDFDNLEYYRFFSERFDASTKTIVDKSNLYAKEEVSLESIVKYYGASKNNKNEFKSVFENGRYNNKKALLVVDGNKMNVILNNNHVLDRFFIPNDLVAIDKNTISILDNKQMYLNKDSYQALEKMCESLSQEFDKKCGNLIVTKGHLDYNQADKLYLKNKNNNNEYNIAAGKNEHRLGSSFDIKLKNKNKEEYLKSKQYKWLKNNAAEYGFIFRYLDGKQSKLNKIPATPYHLRYVGKTLALKLSKENMSLEEYYESIYNKKEVEKNEK